jgi:uncharacterized phiE125 gp8 family phage protein
VSSIEYILITSANIEPLTLNEVKTHLRLDGNSSFDNQLNNLIKVAREYCEQVTGRDLINKTYRALLNCMPKKLEIEKSKLQSITSIKYYSNSILQTLPIDKYYITQSNDYSFLIVNNNHELNIDDREQAVNIDFVAGYGENADSVPQGLKQAMLSYITYLFQNAGDCAEEGQFENLFVNYKIPENMVFFI